VANSDCKSCHAMSAKSIGPSWMDVSKRYSPAGESAVPMLAKKVITGGNGNWGKNVMSAHPQHTEAETAEMTRYILSLAAEATQRLPLAGSYTPSQADTATEEGSYVISASYADKGNPVTGSLTGRKLIILRNPKVQAESYTLSANVDRKHQDGSTQSWVGDIKDGSYLGFGDIDLTGITKLEFNVAAMPSRGGRVEIRAGSSTGKLLGTADVTTPAETNTGTGRKGPQWQIVTAPIANVGGSSKLFFVFHNDQVKDKNLMIVDWILFARK